MPDGRRKQAYAASIQEMRTRVFQERVIAFDEAAAQAFGPMVVRAQSLGVVVTNVDAQIAAIAQAHGLAVASRDVSPFRAMGVPVIDPFRER